MSSQRTPDKTGTLRLGALLRADLARQYHFAGDPARPVTRLRLLAALFSPRFAPIAIFRFSHWCFQHRLGALAKLFSLLNFVVFGLEIAVRCEIGPGLYFPHTQGTVIGALSIGANATIYHNVTFGAREIDIDYQPDARPVVGNDVVVGAGAKVLGAVMLGDGARVGANAVVLENVAPGTTVVGIPARPVAR